MIRLLSLLGLFFCQTVLAAWPYDAVCELQNGDSGGSATLVAVDANGIGLLISCHHVFEEGVFKPYVNWKTGGRSYVKVIGFDKQADLSAMLVKAPPGVMTPRCVRSARPEDKIFMAVGYPWYSKGQNYTIGAYLRFRNSDVLFEARPYVHSGFSGGALLTQEGDFVGVVCGYGNGYSYAASDGALTKFVSQWMETGK